MNEIYTAYYLNNDYRLYLMHHGVKGQKWGVRRYQNLDGTLTDAGRKQVYGRGKTGVIERTKIRVGGAVSNIGDTLRNTKNAKGIANKASELVGHGAARTRAENRAYTEKRLKEASKTRLGKALHEARSYNASSAAQYHAIKKNQSLARRAGEMIIPVTALQMPLKTISGRRTTVAQKAILTLAGANIGNIALDVAYARSNKNGGKFAKGISYAGDTSKKHYNDAAARADSSERRSTFQDDVSSAKKTVNRVKSSAPKMASDIRNNGVKKIAAASIAAENVVSKGKDAIKKTKEDIKKERNRLKK